MISQATRFHYIASDCRLRPLVRSYSLARTIAYSEFNRSWMQTLSSRCVTPRKVSLNQSRKVSLLLSMKHLVPKNAIERLLGPRYHQACEGGQIQHASVPWSETWCARTLSISREDFTLLLKTTEYAPTPKKFDIKSNKHRTPSISTPFASHESYPRPFLSFCLTVKNTYTNTRPHIILGSSDYLSPTPGFPDASFLSVVTDYVKNSPVTVKNQAELWALEDVCTPLATSSARHDILLNLTLVR